MSNDARQIEIEHEQRERGGAFVMRDGDDIIAELTYRCLAGDRVAADHTFVDDSLRGQGVAKQLLDAIVAHARDAGWTIRAECSYVARSLEKDPSLADVIALP